MGTYQQAVLALRWLFDDTRMTQLARDNGIGVSTAYDYRDVAITVLAARKPSLRGALLAAKAAGHTHVILDGSLIHTDRISTPGPTRGVDLWWSGKHRHHGGNIQVVSAPDGWPLWTSPVRPGREHDTTAARADPDLLDDLAAWVDDGQLGLADLGHEGEADLLRIPIEKTAHGELTVDNPRYTGYAVFGRWVRRETLLDPDDVAAGHVTRFRRAAPERIVRSRTPAHPAIVSVKLFTRAQLLRRTKNVGGLATARKAERAQAPRGGPICCAGWSTAGVACRARSCARRRTTGALSCTMAPGSAAWRAIRRRSTCART